MIEPRPMSPEDFDIGTYTIKKTLAGKWRLYKIGQAQFLSEYEDITSATNAAWSLVRHDERIHWN